MRVFTLLLTFSFIAFHSFAKKELEQDHFIIQGKVYEVNLISDKESSTSQVQIVIYQDKDIYVAFFT